VASGDTRSLIRQAVENLQNEVPALKQLKLVLRLDLRARRESQTWRVQLPELNVKRDPAADAKVTVLAPRSHFNELAKDGRLQHWRDAYQNGYLRVTGQDEILKLIGRVIERHETRAKIKKRRF
jgi:hypothetical protein